MTGNEKGANPVDLGLHVRDAVARMGGIDEITWDDVMDRRQELGDVVVGLDWALDPTKKASFGVDGIQVISTQIEFDFAKASHIYVASYPPTVYFWRENGKVE